jgi:hypothetical protein
MSEVRPCHLKAKKPKGITKEETNYVKTIPLSVAALQLQYLRISQ